MWCDENEPMGFDSDQMNPWWMVTCSLQAFAKCPFELFSLLCLKYSFFTTSIRWLKCGYFWCSTHVHSVIHSIDLWNELCFVQVGFSLSLVLELNDNLAIFQNVWKIKSWILIRYWTIGKLTSYKFLTCCNTWRANFSFSRPTHVTKRALTDIAFDSWP